MGANWPWRGCDSPRRGCDSALARLLLGLPLALMGCERASPPPPPTGAGAGIAGGAGTGTGQTSLRLVAQFPPPGAGNVWQGAPIALTFSAPLDPSSLARASLVVQGPDGTLLTTQPELSPDRTTLQLRLEPPHLTALPAELRASFRGVVTDGAGGVFQQPTDWSWTLPLWQVPEPTPPAVGPDVAFDLAVAPDGSPLLAMLESGAGSVRVARMHEPSASGSTWTMLGSNLHSEASRPVGAPSLEFDAGGAAVVAWQTDAGGSPSVYVTRFEGTAWLGLGPPVLGAVQPRLLRLAQELYLAWRGPSSELHLRRWSGTEWVPEGGPWSAESPILDYDLAFARGELFVAITVQRTGRSEAFVWRPWAPLGVRAHALATRPGHSAQAPRLAAAVDGSLYVSWQEHDGTSSNLFVARQTSPDAWQILGGAVDVVLDANSTAASLSLGPSGRPLVTWSEATPGATNRRYAARWTDTRWEVIGGRLNTAPEPHPRPARVALGSNAQPILVWFESPGPGTGGLVIRRQNATTQLPFGLGRRPPAQRPPAPCRFPADGDPAFPQRLSDTGCYADLRSATMAPGIVPYSINAPLWSDGALKRRYFLLPDNTTIEFSERDGWGMPVGSTLIKEFILERVPGDASSRHPVETRFLVKRCESGTCRAAWQGYSYRWSEDGSDGTLLDNLTTLVVDWPVGSGRHGHTYPTRKECVVCHALAPGGTLGLQTLQMNRRHEYGSTVDNQLRAFVHAGLFGASLRPEQLQASPRLPRPGDSSHSDEVRTRAYFHSNCSHCHRPDGKRPEVDLLFDAPLTAAADPTANICNNLVPGNAEASLLFQKMRMRKPNLPPGTKGDPMPPLGTLIADPRQLEITKAWINSMRSCP